MVKDSPQDVDVLYWLSNAALEFVAFGIVGKSLNSISGTDGHAHPLAQAIKDVA